MPVKKRYNLVIPQGLYDQVATAAEERGDSVVGLLRKFIKLGIEIETALDRGEKLVKKDGDKETELIII